MLKLPVLTRLSGLSITKKSTGLRVIGELRWDLSLERCSGFRTAAKGH